MTHSFTRTDLSESSLVNHFLIAMPGLDDPNFSQSITYICEHTHQGAMGLVINQPMDMKMAEVLEQMGIDDAADIGDTEVLYGGPVQPGRGFVLHSGEKTWPSGLHISGDIYLTASRDIIEDIANDQGPEQRLFLLGYAGWDAGQLEQELADNAWLTIPADANVLFTKEAHQRWQAAADSAGIDLNLIAATAGHA